MLCAKGHAETTLVKSPYQWKGWKGQLGFTVMENCPNAMLCEEGLVEYTWEAFQQGEKK